MHARDASVSSVRLTLQLWMCCDRTLTWFLTRRPNSCPEANSNLPLNLSPPLLRSRWQEMSSSKVAQSSATLSSVLQKSVRPADCLRSNFTPRTLHTVSYASSLSAGSCQPRILNRDAMTKSVCLSVSPAVTEKKSSK